MIPPDAATMNLADDYTAEAKPGLRIPPHSVEAEQAVLGGLLLDNGALERVDALRDSDFYRHEHRLIYAAIGVLLHASKPADVITVFDHLQGLRKADECGGLVYLSALAQSVPSAANMRHYAEIVREQAALRKLVAASDEIASRVAPSIRKIGQSPRSSTTPPRGWPTYDRRAAVPHPRVPAAWTSQASAARHRPPGSGVALAGSVEASR